MKNLTYTFSPLDTRYAKDLPASLSEQALLEAQVEVERAWLEALIKKNLCPRVTGPALTKAWQGITFEEIEEVEARTRHATRALVEVLAARLVAAKQAKAAAWVHVGLTSFDTVDTAARLRVKRFFEEDALPQIALLKKELRRLARKHQALVCVGRTHGQWAVPSLFGLQFAEAHERIETIEERLQESLARLTGQSSGAIGGYHASSLLVKDALALEKDFLERLGLKSHYGSTQILPPEDLVAVASDFASLCGVAAKIANDLRHLARSEIGEVAEGFAKGQVGSSTMPQKRNPWNLEHCCSLHKLVLNRLQLVESDVVSEHQRDLTNSASGRFYHEVYAMGFLLVKRLTKVLGGLEIVRANVNANLERAGASVLAEAYYVIATMNGAEHAHDVVREASRAAEANGTSLDEELRREPWFPKKLTAKAIREQALEGSHRKFAAIARGWKKD